MTPAWLFRVASHRSQGGGHVARSGVLARALARRVPVRMVLDPDSEEARIGLESLGLDCVTAGNEGTGPWAGAVVDGYPFRRDEAARIAARVRPLVWLDDFLDPPHCADLVVNGACHLVGDEVAGIPALLGPRYALVDQRLAALPERDRTASVERVLVSFGRLDPDDAAGLALDALALLAEAGIAPAVTVVCAERSTNLPRVRERAVRAGGRVTVETDVPDMVPLLAEADLAIGAGGVSLMERMAAGVPSASLVIADNQRLFVEGAAAEGGTLDAGDARMLSPQDLAAALRPLFVEPDRRKEIAAVSRRLIDGRGAERVAAAILRLGEKRREAAG